MKNIVNGGASRNIERFQICHIKSFTHKKYTNETELSKLDWLLEKNKTDFTIIWSIIKKSISYTGVSKRCNLCLDEKITILKEKCSMT